MVWWITLLLVCPQERRPLEVEDLYRIRTVEDPQVSPDGKTVAYVLHRLSRDRNANERHIWTVAVAGGDPKQFTHSDADEWAPRWSPDGSRLAFLSNRGESTQIWLIARDGGEARKLTNLPNGAGAPHWSPDGARIAFIAAAEPGSIRGPKSFSEDEEKPSRKDSPRGDPRIVRRGTYRAKGKYFDGTVSQIYTVALASEAIVQVTADKEDVRSLSWSHDGKEMVYASNHDPQAEFTRNSDLFTVTSTGGPAKARRADPAPQWDPACSPDGDWVAYREMAHAAFGNPQTDLWIEKRGGGGRKNLSATLDRIVTGGPVWAGPDLYFSAPDHGSVRLYRATVEGKVEPVSPDRAMVNAFSVAGGVVAMALTRPHEPAALWIGSGGAPVKRTRHNAAWLSEVWLAPQEEVTYPSGPFEIQGWFQPAYGTSAKVPLIVEIHGGPAWFYGWRWFFELQLLSSKGYAVLYTNPRGSTGYGTKFHRANEKDWGGGDYRDIMAGVDHILKTRQKIDPDRLGVTGGSYGGYMTNWVIGHTDRFKAAVTQRCVSNLNSFVNSDIHMWLSEVYFETTPWDGYDLLRKHSPIAYVKQMKTPLLIIHSEGDFRCPISQAEELFVSLKKLNQAPVEFVRYPEETHGLSRSGTPKRRIDRLERIVGWFDTHLK